MRRPSVIATAWAYTDLPSSHPYLTAYHRTEHGAETFLSFALINRFADAPAGAGVAGRRWLPPAENATIRAGPRFKGLECKSRFPETVAVPPTVVCPPVT